MGDATSEVKCGVTHSVLRLQGSGDGASWWIGGSVLVPGAAGATAILEHGGSILARALIDEHERATFFSNKPILPIGYASMGDWLVCVDRPKVGPAIAELGTGPELQVARPELDHRDPEAWAKHACARSVACTVPVGIVSQEWVPRRLSKRARLLGANNEFILASDSSVALRWSSIHG
jgi:hypothetical protein